MIENCDAKGVPVPFAIAFCTADESAGTGGEIIRYERAVWYVKGGRVRQSADHEQVGVKITSGRPQTSAGRWTKKIRSVHNVEIRNVFLHLILEINGRSVR